MQYHLKAWTVVGFTYLAAPYCADCGEKLPEVDPEGNPKHPVFVSDVTDSMNWNCDACGLSVDQW